MTTTTTFHHDADGAVALAPNSQRFASLRFRPEAGPTRRFPNGNDARWEASAETGLGDPHTQSMWVTGTGPTAASAVEACLALDLAEREKTGGPHWAFGLRFTSRALVAEALAEALRRV